MPTRLELAHDLSESEVTYSNLSTALNIVQVVGIEPA